MGKPALDRDKAWFLRERPPASPEALIALAMEANRRKISYGQLVANTAGLERFEIVEAYRRRKKRRDSNVKKGEMI